MGAQPSLFSVVSSGDVQRTEEYLREKAKDGSLHINATDPSNFDYTALHYAAKSNFTDIGVLLVRYGADINAKTAYGYTPLHLAALWNSYEFGKWILGENPQINVGDVCIMLCVCIMMGSIMCVGRSCVDGWIVFVCDVDAC